MTQVTWRHLIWSLNSGSIFHDLLPSLQVNWVSKEWAKRAALPSHVVTMLDNFPTNLHPMSQFSAAITALNSESNFARAYSEGVHKSKYWEVSLQPDFSQTDDSAGDNLHSWDEVQTSEITCLLNPEGVALYGPMRNIMAALLLTPAPF